MIGKLSNCEGKMYSNDSNTKFKVKWGEIVSYIIQCVVMRLSEKDSLNYLYDKGIKISVASFYRHKRKIQNSTY
jgi:hypothetical protein